MLTSGNAILCEGKDHEASTETGKRWRRLTFLIGYHVWPETHHLYGCHGCKHQPSCSFLDAFPRTWSSGRRRRTPYAPPCAGLSACDSSVMLLSHLTSSRLHP